MNEFAVILDAFHFIRPLWLLLLPVIGLAWWGIRRGQVRQGPPADGIAPHLRTALTVGADSHGRIRPIDGVALGLLLLVIGAAGPTWSRTPDPFVAQTAPLVVVLEVTPSMAGKDIAPSRLERGKQKIRDLLDLRGGARTALVAYAGSAHGVVPMTEDPAVMLPYLEGLIPEIMPVEGDQAGQALGLAADLLSQEETPGGILFVADGLDPVDAPALDGASTLAVLAMLPEDVRDRGLDQLTKASVIPATPDATDVNRIDRLLAAAYREALLQNTEQPWEDRAHWLAWPVILLTLLWFRRGWTMRWAPLLLVVGFLPVSGPARADGITDWFLTPDQQGMIAYRNKHFERAAELFADPLWRGYALFRDGQYETAIEVLDRVETAEASYIQGMAQIRSRGYRDGVRAFETTLERDPDYPHAEDNLAVAREIVDYIERVREQSDTGEHTGEGADDVVFDNEANRGADTELKATQDEGMGMMTTDQWMNTVDTRTGDFLRQRFALEAVRAGSVETTSSAEEPATGTTQ